MATELSRDNEQEYSYQEKDGRNRNNRLRLLLANPWNPYCIQRIDRVDQDPNTYGWQVTY